MRVPTGNTCLSSETTLNLNSYVKTVLVSPGATNVASGTNLQNALTTATTGTLIKLEPGTYDLGTTHLTMTQGVDLEGSGEGLTTITSQVVRGSSSNTSGTVVITNSSEIRFLTIANNGTTTSKAAVYGNGVDKTAKLTNVTISVSGGGNSSYGINNNGTASPTIKNVTITVSGGSNDFGISNFSSSSPHIQNVTVTAGSSTNSVVGINNDTVSSPIIQNSNVTVTGGNQNFGILTSNNSAPAIQNSIITSSGSNTNTGIYNASNTAAFLIMNSTISVSGGNIGNGILNTSSSPIIQNVIITVSASGQTNGIFNNANSNAAIRNSTISVSGGGANIGIAITLNSALVILNSSVSASGGGNGNSSISVNNGGSAKVGNSQLTGAVFGSPYTCVGDYDDNFVALGAACV